MPSLTNIDLNLFLVLHTILEERSVTRAARRLHVTQAAASNALARARKILGDPLVTRTPRGLVPTPHAAALLPMLSVALENLRRVAELDAAFDPRTTTRRFSIACTDYEEVVLAAPLRKRMDEVMPRAALRVVTLDHLRASDGLSSGGVDVLVGAPANSPPGCTMQSLASDEIVFALREGHPRAALADGARTSRRTRRVLSVEDYFTIPQVRVALFGEPGHIGRAVEQQVRASFGRTHQTALAVPHFFAAALAASQTDLLAPLPRRLATALASRLGLLVFEQPADMRLPSVPVQLLWHAQSEHDASVRFFIALLRDTIQQIYGVTAVVADKPARRRPSQARPASAR